MVTNTFGDILFSPGSECLKEFPSPESLKKRIIISTKPPKEYLKTKEVPKESESQKEKTPGEAKETSAWGREVSSLKCGTVTDYKVCDDLSMILFIFVLSEKKNKFDIMLRSTSQQDLDEDSNDEEDTEDGDLKSSQNLAPEYKNLIAIHAGKPKGGIDACLKVDPEKVRRLSLSEQQLEKAVLTHGKQIVRYE